jgi:hypothetical protein
MSYTLNILLLALLLFLGMLLLMEGGRRLALRRAARHPEKATAGLGAVEGAVFGFMGLLVAFTFSGAASRFDARRHLVVEETNDIGTAYLRLDLLPATSQPALRESFRRYVDSRLAAYRKLPDLAAAKLELATGGRLQSEIWTQAVDACLAADSPATTTLVLSALNAMIDITTTRTMAAEMHPPVVIFVMLFVVALTTALLAGYSMAANPKHSWVHKIGFAAIVTLAVYVILDLEYPRLGLIRVDAFDRALEELRESMNP